MVYWSVAHPSSTPGEVLVRSGYLSGDDAAFAQIVESGVELVAAPDGAQPLIWATLSTANALIESFGQTAEYAVLESEVRHRIAEAAERERTTPFVPRIHRTDAKADTGSDTSVHEQWARIDDWIRDNVPGITLSGAGPESIDAAMAATGQQWPSDLVDLFGHINGVPAESWMALLPRHKFLSLDDVVRYRDTMIRIWNDEAESYETEPIPPYAGDLAHTFIPEFVPFACLDSNYLCVDTRPGPLSGCVVGFDKSGADYAGPKWLSVTALLTELADSLTSNADFDEGWRPVIRDNTVEWEHDRSWAVKQLVLRACR